MGDGSYEFQQGLYRECTVWDTTFWGFQVMVRGGVL